MKEFVAYFNDLKAIKDIKFAYGKIIEPDSNKEANLTIDNKYLAKILISIELENFEVTFLFLILY